MMQPDIYQRIADALRVLEKKHGGEAWFKVHETVELGFLPGFILDSDPRPVREQIDDRYKHGGGWFPFSGFKLLPNGDLSYPEDEPTKVLAMTRLRDEIIIFYEHSWLVVMQPSGEWEVARID